MFASLVYELLSVLCIAYAAGSREEATEKPGKNNGNASITLRRCISDAVLCASEYLRTDVLARSQQMHGEYVVQDIKGRRRCLDAGRKLPATKLQDVCKETGCGCRYSRKEQRLMRLVRHVDAAAFKRFLYGKNNRMSGDEVKGAEGAVCGTQMPKDPDDKFRLHMSSYLKRWLFLIAYLGYSFLRPELYSSDLGSDVLALLPLVCVIKTEVSRKENRQLGSCKICKEPNQHSCSSRVCKSCINKKLMEKYNRVKQAAQKTKEDRQSGNCKNLQHSR